MKWSIQVFHDARDKDDKPIRGCAVYQGESEDLGSFIEQAKEVFKDREDVKLGAILPGWHERIY